MNSAKKVSQIAIVLIAVFFSSCISTQTVKRIIKTGIENRADIHKASNIDCLIIKTDSLHFADSAAVVKRKKFYFIPGIIYWAKVNSMKCDINNRYFSNSFSGIVCESARKFRLKDQLGTKKIEINLESVPSGFLYSDKFFAVLPVIFSYYFESIQPINPQIKVSYRILDGDKTIKTGRYSADVIGMSRNNYNRNDLFIDDYINLLFSNFEFHSEKLIIQILDDLY